MGKAQRFDRLKRAYPGIFNRAWYYKHKEKEYAFKFVLSQNARGKTQYYVEHLRLSSFYESLNEMVRALAGKAASASFGACYVWISEYPDGDASFLELEEKVRAKEWAKKFLEHKDDIKKLSSRESSLGWRMPWEVRRSMRLASPALKELLKRHKPE